MADIIRKLSPQVAQDKIREIATFGNIITTFHCSFDSMDERNYSIHDVEIVLRKGTVKEPPEYDDDHGQWKYKVEGKTIDGDKAVVVTVILSHHELLAITIMLKDR